MRWKGLRRVKKKGTVGIPYLSRNHLIISMTYLCGQLYAPDSTSNELLIPNITFKPFANHLIDSGNFNSVWFGSWLFLPTPKYSITKIAMK